MYKHPTHLVTVNPWDEARIRYCKYCHISELHISWTAALSIPCPGYWA